MSQSKIARLIWPLNFGGLLPLCAQAALVQTTVFTYQGKLTDAGNPANGNYDLQFKLFDTRALGTGHAAGATSLRQEEEIKLLAFNVQTEEIVLWKP
jgi:hypothetical protein